jgi:hypothetical protein
MKKTNIVISFIFAIIFMVIGLKYFDSKKAEVGKVENPSTSLTVQVGLPPLVEAKRQAIYKAAISHDFLKLNTELEVSKDLYTLYGFDTNGKSKNGISGYTKFIDEEKNVVLFDLIQALLKLPYSVSDSHANLPDVQNWWVSENLPSGELLYAWPSMVIKSQNDWTASDIANMKTFLTDEQIERFKEDGYSYFNIVITSDGKWVSGYGRRD